MHEPAAATSDQCAFLNGANAKRLPRVARIGPEADTWEIRDNVAFGEKLQDKFNLVSGRNGRKRRHKDSETIRVVLAQSCPTRSPIRMAHIGIFCRSKFNLVQRLQNLRDTQVGWSSPTWMVTDVV